MDTVKSALGMEPSGTDDVKNKAGDAVDAAGDAGVAAKNTVVNKAEEAGNTAEKEADKAQSSAESTAKDIDPTHKSPYEKGQDAVNDAAAATAGAVDGAKESMGMNK